jgi:hypothetical protein
MRHDPDQMRKEGTPEDTIEGMLASRKAVETKYGKVNLASAFRVAPR